VALTFTVWQLSYRQTVAAIGAVGRIKKPQCGGGSEQERSNKSAPSRATTTDLREK